MKLTTVTIFALLMATSAASDTPENALLAQSVTAWEDAQQASDPAERLAALQAAHSAINTFLEDHDQSDLAANITLEQGGLPFSQSELVEAISRAQAEISQDSDTESVNDVIATATRLLATAASLEVAELETALQAYLMMREADAMLTSAPERFPFARNLDVLETTDVFQQRAELMTEASQQVVNLCDGNFPKSCLLLEAEPIARGLEDEAYRIEALLNIAGALAEARQFSEAERIARGLEYDRERSEALLDIAGALAETGQFSEAERIAQGFEDDGDRSLTLTFIARALAQTGQVMKAQEMFSGAEDIARGIEDDVDRSLALINTARALAETGQVVEAQEMFSEAERIARGIEDDVGDGNITFRGARSGAFRTIVRALAEARQFSEAERIARRIEDDGYRISALSAIAVALAETGQVLEAREMFSEAERIARALEDDGSRIVRLHDIVGFLALAGQFSEAERISREIEDSWSRSTALRVIAQQL